MTVLVNGKPLDEDAFDDADRFRAEAMRIYRRRWFQHKQSPLCGSVSTVHFPRGMKHKKPEGGKRIT